MDRRFSTALLVAAILGTGLSGCSKSANTSNPTSSNPASSNPAKSSAIPATPSMSAVDLQKALTDQLTQAGSPPKSLTCKADLVGEAGKTTICDVVFSDTNILEAKVTATKVDSSGISYDVIPAITKEQLARKIENSERLSSGTVTCAAGVDGILGASTQCQAAAADGVVTKFVAEVNSARGMDEGLDLGLAVSPLLSRTIVQDQVLQMMNSRGLQAESVECLDDLIEKVGATVDCVAAEGNQRRSYEVSVTKVSTNSIDIDYSAKP